jgi:hypothetical protein
VGAWAGGSGAGIQGGEADYLRHVERCQVETLKRVMTVIKDATVKRASAVPEEVAI